MKQEHLSSWKNGSACQQAKRLMKEPQTTRATKLLTMSVDLLKELVGFRTLLYNLRESSEKAA